jgi:tetratricopeptide (TPR) repeat protein/TolB-like protein
LLFTCKKLTLPGGGRVPVPLRRPDRRQVEAALEEFLGWRGIARSPQLANFLSYIVSAKLRGEEAGIKAYAIAVDVLGRPPSFDPQTDPIVRVQARRLRSLLDEFYQGHAHSGVRIRLPVGRYVPEFEFLADAEPDADDWEEEGAIELPPVAAKPHGPWWAATQFWRPLVLFAVLVGGVSIAGYLAPGTMVTENLAGAAPGRPMVVVGAFDNLSGLPSVDAVLVALGERLSADLSRFEELEVRDAVPSEPANDVLVLAGTAKRSGEGFLTTVSLSNGPGGDQIWSVDLSRPIPGARIDGVVAGLSRAIVREIAPFRGAAHMRGRAWLNEHARALPAVSGYVCLLRYHYARERLRAVDIAAAIDCLDRLIREQPETSATLAAKAWLESNAALAEASPDTLVPDRLAQSAGEAARAVELAPESSFAREQLAAAQDWMGEREAAQQNFAAAVSLNPLNTDARAAYATALGRAGEWGHAGEQARLALADAAYPAPWYYFPMTLAALRARQFEDAMESGAHLVDSANGEMGSLLVLAAAGQAGVASSVANYLTRAMTMEHLRRLGIMSWLRVRILDEDLLSLIEQGLLRAGVPRNALTQPF